MKSILTILICFLCMQLFAQNKVGINNTSPEHELDIKSNSANGDADFKLSNSDGTRFLKFYSGNNINKRPMILLNRSDTFRIANSEPDSSIFRNRFTLNPQGYIGINNPIPGYEIDAMGLNNNDAAELNVRTPDNATFLRLSSGRLSDPTPRIYWKQGTNLLLGDDEFGFSEKFRFQSDGRMGVGVFNPSQMLDVEGKIEIGDDAEVPTAGTMRFNSSTNDFEGYNGEEWISMTKRNSYFGSLALEENKGIENPNGGNTEYFGASVDINGSVAVVGSYSFSTNGNPFQGIAYVYEKSDLVWEQVAELTASDGASGHSFGQIVRIDGEDIAISANNNNSVYIFEKPVGGWSDMTETAKLTPSDVVSGNWFGFHMDYDDETIIVALRYQAGGGRAYIYVKPSGGWTTTTETAQLTSTGSEFSFGFDVGITADAALVGTNASKVYVFEKPPGGWSNSTETAVLTSSEGVGIAFGNIVDIHNNDAIVGASGYDAGSNSNQGKVYVFSKPIGGWSNMTETAQVWATDGLPESRFGTAVSIDEGLIAVGARNHNLDTGRTYLFEKPAGGWHDMSQNFILRASDEETGADFGSGIGVSSGSIIIGAADKTVSGNTLSGKIYFFDR